MLLPADRCHERQAASNFVQHDVVQRLAAVLTCQSCPRICLIGLHSSDPVAGGCCSLDLQMPPAEDRHEQYQLKVYKIAACALSVKLHRECKRRPGSGPLKEVMVTAAAEAASSCGLLRPLQMLTCATLTVCTLCSSAHYARAPTSHRLGLQSRH